MGLIGGIARTAVVAGTFTAVSNRVSRRQSRRWAQQDQSAYPPQQYAPQYAAPPPPQYAPQQYAPAAPSAGNDLDLLTKMAQLHDQGVLTDEEFAAEKKKILGL
jgi:putative oligomerization/nucleic acid binding protein